MGYVLLVGIVIGGAIMVVILGAPIMEGIQGQQSDDTTELAMQEVDGRLSTLSAKGETGTMEFSFGDGGEQIQGQPELVENQGYIEVTINENTTCSARVDLDSIRTENDRGEILAYEAGGLWRQSADGGVVMVTPPSVSITDGHLDISVVNMTGEVDRDTTRALVNATTSQADSTKAIESLLQGECKRPDNVTMTVQSDFYQAWGEHLSEETGYEVLSSNPADGSSNLTVDDTAETARVYLNQSSLPPRTNDSQNSVIDVTNKSAYMQNVSITQNGIAVDKNANNNYTVYAEPVVDDVEIGTIRRVSADDNVTRRPLDVVFVVDESGSMGGDGPMGTEKRESTREAIRNFTTYLDSDIDRVSLVGFQEMGSDSRFPYEHPNYGRIYRTNGNMLTDNFEAFNDTSGGTLEKLQADGWTYTAGGMKKATALLELRSNESRDKIIVLLSDGKNTHNHEEDWWVNGDTYESWQTYTPNIETYSGESETGTNAATVQMAKLARKTGVTTYSVGFGIQSNIPDDFLEDVADAGGGWYNYTSNQDELREAFKLIAKRVSSTQQIGRTPLSTNLSAGGTIQPPQITGNTGNVANVTKNGNTFLNANDPLAPSSFSHSFSVGGGDMVNFSASTYSCNEWVATSMTKTLNGSTYPVTRCANMSTTNATTLDKNNVSVFTNTDSAAFNRNISGTNTSGWQTNLTDAVVNRSLYNRTSNKLTLASNEVLVLFDFPDGKNTDNKMLMLYTVGLSDRAAPTGIIDFEVSNVKLERGS
ncbi:Putative pilin/flagellin [Halorhabdus sp. SVX81]|uniref:vWA domain-containing protein n=1 Tax=Halorhabdus sp. SVX81 TaxID=2978283 RepID=UPI0023DCA68C|nr:vWA domain-containing protein [Halorhabdus sp. SVX81]WEL17874.1 Putative pilin/flagellin [Halorhabdus sp. SVX81]